MKERLEEKLLHTLVINKEAVRWIKPGKEIWLGNRMFDIKSALLKNGQYVFTGLYDDEETLLVLQMRNSQQKEKKSGDQLLIQLFQLLQTPCESQQPESADCNKDIITMYHTPHFNLLSQHSDIITPPPQL